MVKRHRVKAHTRKGRKVREHTRGSETKKTHRLISKDTLQYIVYKDNGYVIKEPKPGFESYPSLDFNTIKKLKGIVPETQLVKRKGKWVLRQKFVLGMKGTESDVLIMQKRIRNRGVTPRGLLPQDIIVDKSGRKWVIDVGNFT